MSGSKDSMERPDTRTADEVAQQVESLVAESTSLMDQLIENMRNQRMILQQFMGRAVTNSEGDCDN